MVIELPLRAEYNDNNGTEITDYDVMATCYIHIMTMFFKKIFVIIMISRRWKMNAGNVILGQMAFAQNFSCKIGKVWFHMR